MICACSWVFIPNVRARRSSLGIVKIVRFCSGWGFGSMYGRGDPRRDTTRHLDLHRDGSSVPRPQVGRVEESPGAESRSRSYRRHRGPARWGQGGGSCPAACACQSSRTSSGQELARGLLLPCETWRAGRGAWQSGGGLGSRVGRVRLRRRRLRAGTSRSRLCCHRPETLRESPVLRPLSVTP